MNIVIVGSGNMGTALASRLVKGGHQVSIVSKDSTHASALATKVGAQSAAAGSAARDADIVIVATPYAEAVPALRTLGDLRGKTVVDITNPLTADYTGLTVGHTTSAAEEIAKAEKSAEYGKWKDWYRGDWLTGIPRTRELVQIFGKRLEDPQSPMPPPVFWTGWEAYYHIMHYEGERTASVD